MKLIKYLSIGLLFFIALPALAVKSCLPVFHNKSGWLGADDAYSVALSKTKTLWLFGDTYYGHKRKPLQFAHNTVGISQCRQGFSIKYYFGKRHTPIFQVQNSQSTYNWPSDGFMHKGMLYVFLMNVSKQGSLNVTGSSMAVVVNPNDPPTQWSIAYHDLSSQLPGLLVGTATAKQGRYQYILATTVKPVNKMQPVYLLRLNLKQLTADNIPDYQYLTQSNQWQRGFDQSNARIIMDNGATEMSLVYLAKTKKWYSVYTQSLNVFAMRSADKIDGLWSAATVIKTITPKNSKVFCYAVKAHQGFSHGKTLGITYACNSFDDKVILKHNQLYRPVFFFQPVS
ncbi:MAG: DUF4185 domain-containing protein [Coxiellaceae bacterium]|nr:DUF4185 domain-containing protein [Coxiellaceae bacterium]